MRRTARKDTREVRCPVCGYVFETVTRDVSCPRCENDLTIATVMGGSD